MPQYLLTEGLEQNADNKKIDIIKQTNKHYNSKHINNSNKKKVIGNNSN